LIVALEEARAQLEIALRDNARWRALRRAIFPASRAPLERALAADPVYRAWSLIDAAIADARALPPATGAAAVAGPAPAGTEAEPLRVELSHILSHIRSEAALRGGAPRALAARDAAAAPAAIAPVEVAPAPMLPDVEEATVSFVIREPGRPSQPPPHAEARPSSAPTPAGAHAGADPAGGLAQEDDAEAEVVIVTRPG
jgi:hypothetical protein